jgi:hypothetical protein
MRPAVKSALVAGALASLTLVPLPLFAMDGVIMKDGKMMMMKDGRATAPMTADLPMPDGTRVTTTGVVMMKSGEERQLNNGDMMLMNGHIMKGGKAMPMQPE